MAGTLNTALTLADLRHPDYLFDSFLWKEWRDTFAGGEYYRDNYLVKKSGESTTKFNLRKSCTPIPTFAKEAITEIRNAIFQRLEDVTRAGGSLQYQAASKGENGGVDRDGASMNSYIGIDVLTELLVMGRVGVYVDAPAVVPTTMAEDTVAPYVYCYRIEDILSWTLEEPQNPGQFKAVLLRDTAVEFNTVFDGIELPTGRKTRYRLVWKDDATGKVKFILMNEDKEPIFLPDSDQTGAVTLDIEVVPFTMPNIGDSLLKDVSSYQKTLLNIISGDVNWLMKSSSPFLTIQEELRTQGAHLKKNNEDGTPGGQRAADQEEPLVGAGRYYNKGMDTPKFIAPPTEPLEISMKFREQLQDEIRKLVNLAVSNKTGSRTESAEAKKISSQGLEAGLSYIGLVLQQTEQRIAEYWAMYENFRNPDVAKVAYPTRYILKEDSERLEEAKSLLDLMDRLPGKEIKSIIAKRVVVAILGGRASSEDVDKIMKDIDAVGYTSSNINDVLQAHKAGLVGDVTASVALGYDEDEVPKAKKDREERAVAILAAQTSPDNNPASRGVPEIDKDPNSGSKEQEAGKEAKDAE